jgi:hypothetical protein
MRFGLKLEVAFFGVFAVVALEGAFDLDRVGVVASGGADSGRVIDWSISSTPRRGVRRARC